MDLDNNIKITKGDTLTIQYTLTNYVMTEEDTATFSIAQGNNVLVSITLQDTGTSLLTFTVPKETMAELPVGTYIYDMYIDFGVGNRETVHFARKLMVVNSAH